MTKRRIRCAVYLLVVASLLCSCFANPNANSYRVRNHLVFQGTPAWELAKAVRWQNTWMIAWIGKMNPELLDYQDPMYGTTLLEWSVEFEKYRSTEALLEAGADPNAVSRYRGATALYTAASYSAIDYMYKKDPKYVKLLLSYGADPNINFMGSEFSNINAIGESPLMESINCGIEKTKALLEAGADINHKDEEGHTAAHEALLYNSNMESIQYAHYLIAEKKAIVSEPLRIIRGTNDDGTPDYVVLYPVDSLRDWVFDLDSEEYKIKMEIVEEFARQGVDYWSTIPREETVERIKSRYKSTWREYLSQY